MKKKLTSLQYLRGIAAFLVVLYHGNGLFNEYYNFEFLNGIFKIGYFGVDIFFVISGFIIYYISHKDIGEKSQFKKFMYKRFVRVFPIYWIVLIPIILLSIIVKNDTYSFYDIFASLLLLPNQDFPILGVAWSLIHEILFYAIFGFILILIPSKKFSAGIIFLWISSTLIMFILDLSFTNEYLNIFFTYIFSSYNLEFFGGAVVASLFLNRKYNHNLSVFLFYLSLSLFILFITNELLDLFKIHRIIAWGIPSILLLYALVTKDLSINNPKKDRIILSLLGNSSYSLYLTHTILLSGFNKVFSSISFYNFIGYNIGFLLIIFFTVIVGVAFHKKVEQPLIRKFKMS